ncbi:hypothetical protein AB3662_17650 [Sorangium cellulosum]|uniref:hypothetical protein n=1 Tax=Sorangium cellulosum TaxID=56 RepID=UPI003D9AADFE
MSHARYYIMPRSSQPTTLSFTAGQRWVQVAIRGVDSGGNAIKKPPLKVQQGGGTLDLNAGCVYEMYFSNHIIKDLSALRAAGEKPLRGINIDFSLSLWDIAGLAQSSEDPPPPPPPGSRPGAPDVPFDANNVYDLSP